jgi:hypothetical protein
VCVLAAPRQRARIKLARGARAAGHSWHRGARLLASSHRRPLQDARSGATSLSLLHLVMGGRVKNPQKLEYDDLTSIDIVGVFPDYDSAEAAWRGAAQRTVDDAEMRYVIVHLHKLLDPSSQTQS